MSNDKIQSEKKKNNSNGNQQSMPKQAMKPSAGSDQNQRDRLMNEKQAQGNDEDKPACRFTYPKRYNFASVPYGLVLAKGEDDLKGQLNFVWAFFFKFKN